MLRAASSRFSSQRSTALMFLEVERLRGLDVKLIELRGFRSPGSEPRRADSGESSRRIDNETRLCLIESTATQIWFWYRSCTKPCDHSNPQLRVATSKKCEYAASRLGRKGTAWSQTSPKSRRCLCHVLGHFSPSCPRTVGYIAASKHPSVQVWEGAPLIRS